MQVARVYAMSLITVGVKYLRNRKRSERATATTLDSCALSPAGLSCSTHAVLSAVLAEPSHTADAAHSMGRAAVPPLAIGPARTPVRPSFLQVKQASTKEVSSSSRRFRRKSHGDVTGRISRQASPSTAAVSCPSSPVSIPLSLAGHIRSPSLSTSGSVRPGQGTTGHFSAGSASPALSLSDTGSSRGSSHPGSPHQGVAWYTVPSRSLTPTLSSARRASPRSGSAVSDRVTPAARTATAAGWGAEARIQPHPPPNGCKSPCMCAEEGLNECVAMRPPPPPRRVKVQSNKSRVSHLPEAL